jgi:phosphate transport system substrate-binding protein
MSQKNETLPLILALLLTVGILGGGYWWFNRESVTKKSNNEITNSTTVSNSPSLPNSPTVTFNFPTDVPQGTAIRIDGSTSMVQINQSIEREFERQFVGTEIASNGQGTGVGLNLLKEGKIDIAAISRPLTEAEKTQGLKAVPIAQDAIAIVVGVNNPFRRGLSKDRVSDIFKGKIVNWSEVGGDSSTIRVINRPSVSGTRQVFQEVVLGKADFGNGANITTLDRDATTPILKALSKDGISYATYAQVANQQTIRTVAIDGLTPEAENYPYYRILYYVYQEPVTPQVKAFLGFVLSPQGQSVVSGK